MADLKRGMVDPCRSLAWNLWHYRQSGETRVWSTAHGDMYNRVMTCRILTWMMLPFFLVAVGLVATLLLVGTA